MVIRRAENPGKIHELLTDAKGCLLVYVLPYIGGFPGMGNKLFAMPRKALVNALSDIALGFFR